MIRSMRYHLLLFGLLWSVSLFADSGQYSFNQEDNAARYEAELNALNVFLEDFSDGYYGYIEVVDDFVVIRFQEGKYSKFKLADMADPVLDTKYDQISWDCKNSANCVLTDWNDEGVETGILFQEMGSINMDYLMDLLSNFISAYKAQ